MMTARALEISEFDVFARAWTFWHGETAPDKQIEKHFAEYMFAERVPGFVRHYTRSAPLPLPRVVRRRTSRWAALFPADFRKWGEAEMLAGMLAAVVASAVVEMLPV